MLKRRNNAKVTKIVKKVLNASQANVQTNVNSFNVKRANFVTKESANNATLTNNVKKGSFVNQICVKVNVSF